MAEERGLAVARALEVDESSNKDELQGRIEETLKSITQTVSEIKDTVANQYDSVKESVTEVLDWREQVRRRPVIWSIGALGIGAVVGYSLGRIIEGDRGYSRDDNRSSVLPTQFEGGGPSAFTDEHSNASHALGTVGGAYGSSEFAGAALAEDGIASRPSYSSGYEQPGADEDKSGLIGRFKETRAYDRLQEEVADLGNRFMNELSNAARTIVLPALFNKVKQMIGIDLSNKRQTNVAVSHEQQPSDPGQSPIAGAPAAGGSSVSGIPAYSSSEKPLGRIDRAANETSTPGGHKDNNLHNNINYDDRYERESKLFSRGENRGFTTQPHGENKTGKSDGNRPADRSDTPRGGNMSYDSGRGAGGKG